MAKNVCYKCNIYTGQDSREKEINDFGGRFRDVGVEIRKVITMKGMLELDFVV